MIKFWKYHGIGNDFVLIENMDLMVPMDAEFVRDVCNRHFGVGADGILYVMPGVNTDITMRILNADGSEAEMCGNGIRCVARYAYEHKLVNKSEFTIHTLAGDLTAKIIDSDEFMVEINMGAPILNCPDIPMDCKGKFINKTLEIDGFKLTGNAVSMGNPHFITFDELSEEKVEELGPKLESHTVFPRRTNVEFAKVRDGKIYIRVYERGAAWTLACGTGACATTVAAALNGLVGYDQPIDVRLPGGWLKITVDKNLKYVLMAGPAVPVYEGILME